MSTALEAYYSLISARHETDPAFFDQEVSVNLKVIELVGSMQKSLLTTNIKNLMQLLDHVKTLT